MHRLKPYPPVALVFFTAAVFLYAAPESCGAQNQPAIENLLPHDSALLFSVENPADVLSTTLEKTGIAPDRIEQLLNRLFRTNLFDATDNDSKPVGIDFLSDISSAHFVLENSRSRVGAFGVLIQTKQTATMTRESLKPMVRLACFAVRRFLVNNSKIGGELDSQIAKFESGYRVHRFQNWTLVTHSPILHKFVLAKIEGEEKQRTLASMRTYQTAKKNVLPDAFAHCFVSPRHLRSISILLGKEAESSHHLDQVAWGQISINTEDSEGSFSIKQLSTFARTTPATGNNRYWDFRLPIKSYPNIKIPNWDRCTGSCIIQSEWYKQYLSDIDNLKDKGPLNSYRKDPVASFLYGLSRESMSDQVLLFELPNGDKQSWYRIKPGLEEQAKNEVTTYFSGMQKNYQQAGYEAKLDLSQPNVWQLDIVETQPQLQAVTSGFDLLGSALTDAESPQDAQARSNSWSQKYATVFQNWFVIGSRDSVIATTREPVSSLAIQDRVFDCLGAFGLKKNRPHTFLISRPNAFAKSFHLLSASALDQVFAFSWRLSKKAINKVREQGIDNSKLTNPQAIGFIVKETLDQIQKRKASSTRLELRIRDNYLICQEITFPTQPATGRQ